MHGNMVFSTHYILGTPQQSGGFLVCSVKKKCNTRWNYLRMDTLVLAWGASVQRRAFRWCPALLPLGCILAQVMANFTHRHMDFFSLGGAYDKYFIIIGTPQ